MQKQARVFRLVRGVIAAVFATFIALFAHVVGGAPMPGWLGIVAPLILSIFVCTVVAGRMLPLLRLSVSVIASQVLFHCLFMLGTPSSTSSGPTNMAMGYHHHGHHTMPAPESMHGVADHAAHMHAGLGMWIAHIAGAAFTVLFLHKGEQILLHLWTLAIRLARKVGLGLLSPFRMLIPLSTARVRPPETRHLAPVSHISISLLRWRGPPMGVR
ncbi:hypothetical protein [uncultured Brevibacterium sp.]|uniref:hypothetical protein n=1 Tax=uncultured Brevibacterium sp. TaxID=189678 RepID=UPI0025E0612E|nr:hypothetical protein [uncultured Brevibacterium sp.]